MGWKASLGGGVQKKKSLALQIFFQVDTRRLTRQLVFFVLVRLRPALDLVESLSSSSTIPFSER
jgi:hypothetical protein